MPEKFVTTAEWGANPSKEATEDSHPIGSTEGVSLHWVGPGIGGFSHSECAGKVRGIERHHEYGNGWGDIAYNALVCPHGWIFEGRGARVRSAANGGTASNDTHYAVCYLGGEGDGFTDEGKAGFHNAVQWLREAGGAGPEVNGHRDHKATACPGDAIYAWLRTHDFDNAPLEDDMFSDDDRETLNRIEQLTRTKLIRVNTRLGRANGLLRDLRKQGGADADLLGRIEAEIDAALAEAGDDAPQR